MKKLYVNVRYLIVPVMTVATIIGLYIGGIYSWIGVLLFGVNTILDTLTKDIHLRADFDDDGNEITATRIEAIETIHTSSEEVTKSRIDINVITGSAYQYAYKVVKDKYKDIFGASNINDEI